MYSIVDPFSLFFHSFPYPSPSPAIFPSLNPAHTYISSLLFSFPLLLFFLPCISLSRISYLSFFLFFHYSSMSSFLSALYITFFRAFPFTLLFFHCFIFTLILFRTNTTFLSFFFFFVFFSSSFTLSFPFYSLRQYK